MISLFKAQQKPPLTRRTGPVDSELVEKSQKILRSFILVYCQKHHHTKNDTLCTECQDLLEYACRRVSRCPYDPKPKCKECPTHCYKPEYRQKIKEVMRFSGMYYVKRGRIDWLFKYFFSNAV
ncbi:MAG: nitrous oxide-stimulated promoter family protein [bacterium]|jgi:hypothetical protein